MSVPSLTYTIKVNGKEVQLNSNTKVSDRAGANNLQISFTTDQNLDYWEARCTKANTENYGIGCGKLIAQEYSVSGSGPHVKNIEVSTTTFNQGDGVYRVGLYAKSQVDGYWDTTYLLFSTESNKSHLEFTSADSKFEILTQQPIPDGSTFK